MKKPCGMGRSYWENGFSGGKCVNFSDICCTSTSTGLHYLKTTGILTDMPDDGIKIITSPNTLPFVIPSHLKHVPIVKWGNEDKKWLQM